MDEETMYCRYARPVYGLLLSLCRSPQTAEELTAETFYQAVRSIGRYDGSCEMKTWLFAIARNVWKQEARRLGRAPVPLEDAEPLCTAHAPPAAEAAGRSETRVALYRKINALDEPYRTVVYLRLAGDLTFEEIGRVLDHTGNWARVTYYRAKERLKEHETTE